MPEDRRLAAIMFTDIVGYTALMGSDEDKAFKVLRKNREIQRPIVKKYRGKWLKEMGDGILASFSTASDAVRCAGEIQVVAKKEGIGLRIGIHEGEVVFEGGDVLGDGVNVASRLEELAEEGCINVSGAVYNDIKNKTGITAEFLAEERLKNVAESIKIYKVYYEKNPNSDLKPTETRIWKRNIFFYISGIIVILALATILIWKSLIKEPQSPFADQLSETEKSIAVLPFVNLSNDPEQEYFSDGMVDEIIDHLFKVGDLKVISRTSSMRFKDVKLSLKEIAEELGVSAILEGSVRKAGNEVRITVQLIDAMTDMHLWSETYEGDLSDVFSIQAEVAQKVAQGLKATLTSRETELIKEKARTANSLAYDFYLKGNDYWARFDAPLALEMYTKAISEDSMFASAYARRASMHLHYCWLKIEGWPGHDSLARKDISKAFQLDPGSIEAKYSEAVFYYMIDRDYDRSIKILNELKEDAPNMAELYAYVSYNLRRQGKWEESINELKQGMLLDPFNATNISNLCGTYGNLHQYDKQIKNAKQGLSLIPDFKAFNRIIFNAILNKTGDLEIAMKESKLKEEDVQFQVYYYKQQYNRLIEFIKGKDDSIVTNQGAYYPRTYELAFIYYLSNNTSQCKIYADSAITLLENKIKEIPNDERLYATLGKCYAFKGNVNKALAFGRKTVDLLPIKLDALQGPAREQDLMEIYIFTSNFDLALDKIEHLLSIPSLLGPGDLLINPIYDNLRDLPRFQKIVNSTQL